MATERYIRLNESVQDYGDLKDASYLDSKKTYEEVIKSYRYRSLYWWPKEAKIYKESNSKGSMAGYTGPAFINKLVFDFDKEQDLVSVKADVTTLLDRLASYDVQESSINVDFSGRKGFHVEVLLDKDIPHTELKEVCVKLAGDLPSFDIVIYNSDRKFRLRNTKHEKSGLYKIPLTLTEFFTLNIDQIKSLAATKRDITLATELVNYDKFKTHLPLEETKLSLKPKSVVVDDNEEIKGLSSINFKKCPPNMPRCIYALMQGVMVRGNGQTQKVMFHLANYLRNNGSIKEMAESQLKTVLELNKQLYPESDNWDTGDRLKREVINPVFDPSYENKFKLVAGASGVSEDNEFIKYYCDHIKSDKPCCLHKAEANNVVGISEISNDFKRFAESFDTNSVKTGIKLIDDNMKIIAGTTTLLIGATGSGKTTLALDIMEKSNKEGFNTMFFSMDMYKNLVYLKLAQKVTNYTQDQIINFYKTFDHIRTNEIQAKIGERYNATFFDFSKTLTIEEMRDRVLRQQDASGKEIKLVVVDYASRLAGPYSDKHANATYNALKSVEVAEATDSAWIYVAQVSRNVGDGSTPLLSKRVAKESGDWEESASNVITVWRPFMGLEAKDDIMRLFLAKNRMGSEIQRPLWWNGALGIVNDMTRDEYEQYLAQREPEEKEVQKNKKSNNSFF